jgi:toxin CcdB
MDTLTRFDLAAYRDTLMVVVESDLLPLDPSVVVIPLLAGYPAVPSLNPILVVEETEFVLATRLITAVRRAPLLKVGNIAAQGDRITRAVDVLMAGV